MTVHKNHSHQQMNASIEFGYYNYFLKRLHLWYSIFCLCNEIANSCNHRVNRPYQVSMLIPEGEAVPLRDQNIIYTSFKRHSSIVEGNIKATFAYNASGDRVKMLVEKDNQTLLCRHYIGNQYECDVMESSLSDSGENTHRLYLGGDAYSAPVVYVKKGETWQLYYICRDYLGSITHIANADGSLKAEYSYNAWGRLRDPETQEVYKPGTEPILFLGRGYTGHEHLPWFGLINMNARLYDPAIGRFLSPDPYVQAPDFTQNLNRYSYCLNNPFSYTDQNGEWIHLLVGAIIGGTANWLANGYKFTLSGLAHFGVGAIAGALGAGIGGGISSMLPTAGYSSGGFWAGFWGTKAATQATSCFVSGALIGGGAGGASGFVSGFGNKLLDGGSIYSAIKQGVNYGLSGLGAGALIYGLGGDIKAHFNGRTFGRGGTTYREYAANNESFDNILIKPQNGEMGCVDNAIDNISASTGSDISGAQIRELVAPGSLPGENPISCSDALIKYAQLTNSSVERIDINSFTLNRILDAINKGPVVLSEPVAGTSVRHAVNIINAYIDIITYPNGKISLGQFYYTVLDNGVRATRTPSQMIGNWIFSIFKP